MVPVLNLTVLLDLHLDMKYKKLLEVAGVNLNNLVRAVGVLISGSCDFSLVTCLITLVTSNSDNNDNVDWH